MSKLSTATLTEHVDGPLRVCTEAGALDVTIPLPRRSYASLVMEEDQGLISGVGN